MRHRAKSGSISSLVIGSVIGSGVRLKLTSQVPIHPRWLRFMQGAGAGAGCIESTRGLWMDGELVRYTGCYVYAVLGIGVA